MNDPGGVPPQVLAQGDKQSVVDGAIIFCGDFQGRFEKANGRLDVDGELQQIIQGLAGFVQGGKPPVVSFPDGIGNFDECQIENDQRSPFSATSAISRLA